MLPGLNMNRARSRHVAQALLLLKEHAPAHYGHFMRIIQAVRYCAGACGPGSVACTGGAYERVVVLSIPPERLSVLELAVTLSHESRHYRVGAGGQYETVPHVGEGTPGLCRDRIYLGDQELRRKLARAVSRPSAAGNIGESAVK